MTTTTERPMTISEAMTLANIASRAATLFEDGYTAVQWDTITDTWTVKKPGGGEYTVVLPIEGSARKCNCPCFKDHGTCKHYLAVEAEHNYLSELAAEYDRMQAEAEYGPFGCDPYPEF